MNSEAFCRLSEDKRRENSGRCKTQSGEDGYSLCYNKETNIILENCSTKICYICNIIKLVEDEGNSSNGNNNTLPLTHTDTSKTESSTNGPTESNSNPPNNGITSSTDTNLSNNKTPNSSKIPEGLIIGGGIGVMVLFVLGFILIINFVRKRKNKEDGVSKERNIPGSKGYDQLDDENYNSYRSFTNSSLQNPSTLIDNKPFNRNDQIYDDVIIVDNKRNNSTQNNYNTSIIYNNENSMIMRNNFHGNDSNMMKMNPNRSFTNGTNSEFHKVNTSILVDSLADTSFQKSANILDNQYGNKAVTKVGSREFTQKNMMIKSNNVAVKATEAKNSSTMFNNMEENANSSPNEIKQAFSNMPYSPTSLSNTSTSTSVNQKYYLNNGPNTIQTPPNVYIISNQNSHNNPFSDSHVVSSPTNGYTYDLTLNQEQNQIKDSENVNQNQNFNNITKNYSYRNEESFIKSPVNKQQTYVSSPPGVNKNLMRNASDNILRATSLSKQRSYTGTGTPTLSMNNINSGNNQSPNGYPSNTENRYSGGNGTPNLSRSSSNKSHHSVKTGSTPIIENIPSGKQTIEHHLSTKSIKTSTATIEKIPSSSQLHHKHSLNNGKPSESSVFESSNSKGDTSMVMSPTQIGKNPQTPTQPKSILKNSNSVSYNTSGVFSSSQDDLNISHSISVKRKRSKSRKATQTNDNIGSTVVSTPSGDINIPPFPSMSRNASGVLRGGDNNNVSIENSSTTPSRPPTLTVYGHALETPPIPKSTRFPQDAMVVPPTVGVTPVPPDILGGTDVVPLNTMTLQRKHFHKKNKSVPAATVRNDNSMDESMIKSKHPLPPVPPLPSNLQNNNKSNDDVVGTITKVNSVKEKERVREQSPDTSHYRSKSLPRPNKNSSRYVEDQSILSSSPAIDPTVLYGLEQELTNFELEFYKENETQKVVKTKNKNSVLSILREERRNMEYYIEHCDD